MVPAEIWVAQEGYRVSVRWPNSEVSHLDAAWLRANCRSAKALRERIDGTAPPDLSDVTITAVEPVGGYGLNIRFSDGHDRGIYPWRYLKALAETGPRDISDFIDG